MSKSGLFAHFRSKRALEIATINQARDLFFSQVFLAASAANEGLDRLWTLCDSWLAHIENRVFAGGYFFTGAFFECAERSGDIETEINSMAREWWKALKDAVQKAQERKEISSSVDARQISFDLNGILMATYWTHLVEEDNEVFQQARTAMLAKMEGLAKSRIPASVFKSLSDWQEYLKQRRGDKDSNTPISALRDLTAKKALTHTIHPPTSPSDPPSNKSGVRPRSRTSVKT